jgi:hypothetical protein
VHGVFKNKRPPMLTQKGRCHCDDKVVDAEVAEQSKRGHRGKPDSARSRKLSRLMGDV